MNRLLKIIAFVRLTTSKIKVGEVNGSILGITKDVKSCYARCAILIVQVCWNTLAHNRHNSLSGTVKTLTIAKLIK